MTTDILKVENLQIGFQTEYGTAYAVNGISFKVSTGKVLGIVGESGCGKSVTAMSLLKLLPQNASITNGNIIFDQKNIVALPEQQVQKIRGNQIALIPQDPLTSLNPLYTIGNQLIEVLKIHKHLNTQQARAEAIELLQKVKIPQPEMRIDEYPHQLSGGMRQRILIAMALCCSPKLLIADEPTTALDVTVQAQIISLMKELLSSGNSAMILITHDLGVVSELADTVAVMYSGEFVETGSLQDIFNSPKHPYTLALLQSQPDMTGKRVEAIEGQPPSIYEKIEGCRFAPRCSLVQPSCLTSQPQLQEVESKHFVSCFLVN